MSVLELQQNRRIPGDIESKGKLKADYNIFVQQRYHQRTWISDEVDRVAAFD